MAFEFDVFLSFSSKDETLVRPIWETLCSSGLRIFWSDSSLKNEIGDSFFDVIQRSILNSKHFLLYCTENTLNSKWVNEEIKAFYNECFINSKNNRKFLILETTNFNNNYLPVLLRGFQRATDINSIVKILGGVDIESLKNQNKQLVEKINDLQNENRSLNLKLNELNLQILNKSLSTISDNLDAKTIQGKSFNKNESIILQAWYMVDNMKEDVFIETTITDLMNELSPSIRDSEINKYDFRELITSFVKRQLFKEMGKLLPKWKYFILEDGSTNMLEVTLVKYGYIKNIRDENPSIV